MKKTAQARLVPDAEVAARYNVHAATLYNWDHNPAMGFPKPVRIRGRKYRSLSELDAFDAARADERESSKSTEAA